MSRWFKITLIRVSVAVAICLILAELLVWHPTKTARNLVNNQIGLTQTALQNVKTAQALLNDVPNPNIIQLGVPNQAQGYAQDTAQVSNGLKNIKLSQPPTVHRLLGVGVTSSSRIIGQVNGLIADKETYTYNDADADISRADRLMHYDQKVSDALVNLLGYNAAQDMTNFSPNSSDTQKRISLAKDGLTKVYGQLQAAQPLYNDPSFNDLLAQVNDLRSDAVTLSQSGDVKTWISQVATAQNKVIANRQAFWNAQKSDLQSRLAQDQTKLLKLNTDWRQVANQNNL